MAGSCQEPWLRFWHRSRLSATGAGECGFTICGPICASARHPEVPTKKKSSIWRCVIELECIEGPASALESIASQQTTIAIPIWLICLGVSVE